MEEFEEYVGWLLEQIAGERLCLSAVPTGGSLWRHCAARLAELLGMLAAGTAESARDDCPPSAECLAESRDLLESLLVASVPGSDEYRWLNVLMADCLDLSSGTSGDERVTKRVIELLERAVAPGGGHGDRFWWDERKAVNARARLALNYWDLSGSDESRPVELRRAIDLLTSLVEGADAALVESRGICRTCLGLALAKRSRGPDHRSPQSRADRLTAIDYLESAFDESGTHGQLLPLAATNLAQLYLAEHDCESPATPHDLHTAIALLDPVVGDDDVDLGATAVDLGTVIATDLHEHEPGRESELLRIDWYRRGIEHPGATRRDLRGYQTDLGFLLLDRAERNRTDQACDEPDPAIDLAEAIVLFEQVLDGLVLPLEPGESQTERDEERLATLLAVFETMSLAGPGRLDDAELDRLIARVADLLDSTPLGERGSALPAMFQHYLADRAQRGEPDLAPEPARRWRRWAFSRSGSDWSG